MLVLLSPAKNLNLDPSPSALNFSQPDLLKETRVLVKAAKSLSQAQLKTLMKVSDKLATLNYERFQSFKTPFTPDNAKQAALTFAGDVYQGLEAGTLKPADLDWAQDHLRILSGLYGLLRPLDLIQPYRLEMGRALKTQKAGNLYDFWGNKITNKVNTALAASGDDTLVNLASDEYFNAVRADKIKGRLIRVNFKEIRDGKPRFISFNAKKARGLMARYMIDKRANTPAQLKKFNREGYRFNKELSQEDSWIFTRPRVC